MNMRLILGYALAFSIGIICQLSGIPVPSPPALIGALIMVAMTLGYIFADKFLAKRKARHVGNCGGSAG